MTKYAIVPVEATDEFRDWVRNNLPQGTEIANPDWWVPRLHRAMLSARPPLDAEMQQALELARKYENEPREGQPHLISDRAIISRQFLRANGEEA